MPVVTMPDGQAVDLPDNPSPDQLSTLQQLMGPASKFADMAKETGRVLYKGVVGGLTGLPGLIGDAVTAASKDNKVLDTMGPTGAIMRLFKDAPGVGYGPAVENTKFGDVTKGLYTLGGNVDIKPPQTSLGKGAANILESVVGTVAGGGAGTLGEKAAIGLGGGVGGEAAARFSSDNPLARLLGSLVGSGGVALGQSFKPNAETMIRQSTEHMTPQDWAHANNVQDTLATNGIQHLKSQLLGPRSTLDDVVALAGSNPSVRPQLITNTADAPGQANQAFSAWKDANLPVAVGERRELLNDIQGTATQALRGARNEANTAFKAAMPAESLEYPPEAVNALRQQLVDIAKSPTYGETTDAGKAVLKYAQDLMKPGGTWDFTGVNPVILARAQKAGVDPTSLAGAQFIQEPVTNAHQINNLIKELNLKATSPDYKGLPLQEVKNVMKAFTDADFGAARAAKADVMTNVYNPMSKGLAGDIANQGGGVKLAKTTANDNAISMVFHKDRAQPDAITDLGNAIGSDGVGTLLREYLAKGANAAFAEAPSEAAAVTQPKHFVDAVIGTPAQKANVNAGLSVVAKGNGVDPAQVQDGFNKLMDAFRSFKDLKLPPRIDQAVAAQAAGTNPISMVVAPHSRFGRYWNDKVMTSTYQQIADIVSSSNGLKTLQAIATSPKQDMAQQVAASILTSAQAGDGKSD